MTVSLLTETEKVKIRAYIGVAYLLPMAISKVESAFSSLDEYTVIELRLILADLEDIKEDLKTTRKMLGAKKTDDVEVDPVKSYIVLCASGNAQIQILGRMLGLQYVTYRFFGGKAGVNSDPNYMYI
jgi:hypothetical protein